MKLKLIVGVALAVGLTWSQRAEACGCFAPPNSAEPIVQAGERILFAVRNGKVIAHIQIQYAGEAKDFGWLLPLPSVPTLKLGSDELFARLNDTTQPEYLTQSTLGASCPRPIGCGCSSPSAINRTQENPKSPLVVSDSVGPYEYAVLRADDKTAMFQWLADNRYFVPAGTDGAVGPYIHPGAYFLALKLKAGARTGDVTPVVLEYASDLPMIPLILTSVGATPNMGVQVFLLGNGRGIPRNFRHVVLNDALLSWLDTANYSALVTKAVSEAPGKHAFVTEYAASSSVMRDQLVTPGRFGTQAELATATTPGNFVATLVSTGFSTSGAAPPVLPSPVIRLLMTDIPYPAELATRSVTENQFYTQLDFYLGPYRDQNPTVFAGYTLAFDAPTLAQQIFEEYVTPMREANALFAEFPKLTRLYTTLSPEDMTEDPVFAFNSDLPEVSGKHNATLINECPSGQKVITEQGWIVESATAPEIGETPAALRIEILGEEGPATVETDNKAIIHERFRLITDPGGLGGGCSTVDPVALGLLTLMWMRRRRSA